MLSFLSFDAYDEQYQIFLIILFERFFFGKNKVMMRALGRTPDDEYRENLHKVANHLQGQMGLMFTNAKEKEVLK